MFHECNKKYFSDVKLGKVDLPSLFNDGASALFCQAHIFCQVHIFSCTICSKMKQKFIIILYV